MITMEELAIIVSKLNEENITLVENFNDACKDFNTWSINLKEYAEKKKNNTLNTDIVSSNNNTVSETDSNTASLDDLPLPENYKNNIRKKPSRTASKLATLKINQQSQLKLNTKMRRPNGKTENNYVVNIVSKPLTDLTNLKTEPHGKVGNILRVINGEENKTKTIIKQQEINTSRISDINGENFESKVNIDLKIEEKLHKKIHTSKNSRVQINHDTVLNNSKNVKLHSKGNFSQTVQKPISLKVCNRVSPLKILQNKIKSQQNISPLKSKLKLDISLKNQSKITSPLSGDETLKPTTVERDKSLKIQNVSKHNVDTKTLQKLDEQRRIREEKHMKALKMRENQERLKEERLKLKLDEKQKRRNVLKSKSKLNGPTDKRIKRNAVQLVYKNIFPHKSYARRNTRSIKTWVKKPALSTQLIIQRHIPKGFIETLFDMKAKTPDLRKFFKHIQAKKLIRNSSGTWSLSTL